MYFEWGSEVVVGGRKAEKIGVGRVEDRGLIANGEDGSLE
jgi:hypothetical protein